MFDAWKKIYYSGVQGDIVRIPNKMKGSVTDRDAGLMIATMGKNPSHKDKNGMRPCEYFGLWPTKDKSESSYVSGYTATQVSSGSEKYRITANKEYHSEYFALEIFQGCSEDIAKNPKSNVNRWLKAISFVPRGFWFWIMSIALSCVIVGIPLLVGCIIRFVQSRIAKSCLRKAKKSYKKEGRIVVF
ncbi:MAG: hypothetical protein IJV99_01730 [Clostridia bacterium]|nr:hypothetical protein [Clostridia bacterium]